MSTQRGLCCFTSAFASVRCVGDVHQHFAGLDRLEHGPKVVVVTLDQLDVCRHGLPIQSLGLSDLARTDGELAVVIEAWPTLAEPVKASILATVKAAR